MDHLKDLLKHRLNTHSLGEAAHASEVLNAANQFLGRQFSQSPQSVRAFRLDLGKLYVRAENSVWAQEAWGIQHKLLKSLQSTFGEKSVQKIVLKWFDPSEEPQS